jgi:hypothetical protein
MVFPMPEVVLQVVPPVLQHIVMLVPCLSPRPPAVGQVFHVPCRYLLVRYPTVEKPPLPLFPVSFPPAPHSSISPCFTVSASHAWLVSLHMKIKLLPCLYAWVQGKGGIIVFIYEVRANFRENGKIPLCPITKNPVNSR